MSEVKQEDLLTDVKLDFLSKYLKNDNKEELKEKALKIWTETKDELPMFSCIQRFFFLVPRIQYHPYYKVMIEDLKSGKLTNKNFFEIGTCFGGDVRQLIYEGWNPKNIFVNDLIDGYWNKSLKLYEDKEELEGKGIGYTFGDLCSADYLEEKYPHLVNKVSFVQANAILHVLSKTQVEQLLSNVYKMMTSDGSVFFGLARITDKEGDWFEDERTKQTRYLHSVQSLKDVLEKHGFTDIQVNERVIPEVYRENGPTFFNVTYPNAKDDHASIHCDFIAYKK